MDTPPRRGRRKHSTVRNLLDRHWTYKHEVLLFLDGFARCLPVPFDDNQAERELRMVRFQQKIAVTFRRPASAQALWRLGSIPLRVAQAGPLSP